MICKTKYLENVCQIPESSFCCFRSKLSSVRGKLFSRNLTIQNMHYYLRKNLFVQIKKNYKFNILQNDHNVTGGAEFWMKAWKQQKRRARTWQTKEIYWFRRTINVDICLAFYLLFIIIACPVRIGSISLSMLVLKSDFEPLFRIVGQAALVVDEDLQLHLVLHTVYPPHILPKYYTILSELNDVTSRQNFRPYNEKRGDK